MSAIPKAVPSSVAPSSQNSVDILTKPQLGPNKPMTGKAIIPVVPVPEGAPNPADVKSQPGFGGGTVQPNGPRTGGNEGTPSVPNMGGALFTAPPIDSHYVSENGGNIDPYHKVNNPPTRGKWQRLQDFINHIAQSPQNVDPNGFRTMPAQQRTSHMRNTLPPHGDGYSPESYQPGQRPQSPSTYKYMPVTGTQPYGTGVLNSDQYGAGQTAGGVGGNQYTPAPGPPDTTSTANNPGDGPSGMPTWG